MAEGGSWISSLESPIVGDFPLLPAPSNIEAMPGNARQWLWQETMRTLSRRRIQP